MRHLARLGHCLAAATLGGAAFAPLQLILWPEAVLSFPRGLLALAAWASWAGVWFGLTSFLIVELVALAAPSRAQRMDAGALWRWLALVQSALITGVAWWNQSETRDLVIPGRRDALSVVAITSGLIMLFLIAVLVSPRLRRRGAVIPMAALALGSACAWAAWAAAPLPTTAAEPAGNPHFTTTRRVLVVSWEGADLPWLLPAIEAGDMPFLRERRDAGAWGMLRTLRPFSRNAALATLATGCNPAVHGVFGRRAYRLDWLSPEPVSLLLEGVWPTPHQLPWRSWKRAGLLAPRRAPLWEILRDSGMKVGLAGWPGVPTGATWDIPAPLASEAVPFSALDGELRSALEPSLRRNPELADATRVAFSVAAEVGAAAALRYATSPVDALVVDSDLPLRLRPLWTPQDGQSGDDAVLRQSLRLLDEQLHALWSLMGGDDALLVVVSPYGLAPPTPWRRLKILLGGKHYWPVSQADSPDGFVLLCGPGVRAGTRMRRGRLADVTPTLLYLLDLPVARDMAGRVLLDGVSDERASTAPLRLIPSYPTASRR